MLVLGSVQKKDILLADDNNSDALLLWSGPWFRLYQWFIYSTLSRITALQPILKFALAVLTFWLLNFWVHGSKSPLFFFFWNCAHCFCNCIFAFLLDHVPDHLLSSLVTAGYWFLCFMACALGILISDSRWWFIRQAKLWCQWWNNQMFMDHHIHLFSLHRLCLCCLVTCEFV